MSKFAEVLKGLSRDDAASNIAAIKGAVLEQVVSTDSRVQVEMTDHFNHSFVPDLILSWPDLKQTRHMFLRTAFRDSDLMRDVETLKAERPILLPLGGVPDASDASDLEVRARQANTLVANPEGLEALEDETQSRPVVSLLSHAVLQGGRGVMTPEEAHSSSASIDEGFEGARDGDANRTSAAIESASQLLDSDRAAQINRLLHAVWVGSGAAGSNFPGSAGITALLDAESLRFVLDLPAIEDDEFWRRLGAGLTLGRLCELVDFPDSENFQSLLRDNAYRLEGKACRVLRTGADARMPKWSVAGRNLVLAVERDRIYYSPTKLDELPAVAGETVPVTVKQLQDRSRAAEIKLREVRLQSGSHAVSYATEGTDDVADSEQLTSLQSVISDASLTSAVAMTESHDASISFSTRTVAGYGPARFPLATLTRIAAPLLIAPSPESATALDTMLSQPTPADEDAAAEPASSN